MSISSETDINGLKKASEAVALTLKKMREYAKVGMSTLDLDEYGRICLKEFGARSAPKLTYGFPGWTCISVNHEAAHGIPSDKTLLKEGDLINIDVSAELGGYWADNGGSFVLGADIQKLSPLVEASKTILKNALAHVRDGFRINELGRFIQTEAHKKGFKVIKNLVGHGIGRSLHEDPKEIPCFYDVFNRKKFENNSVVAIETFISTGSSYVNQGADGWTLKTGDGSFVAQHEHTLIVTKNNPIILTEMNGIWN